MAAMTFARRWLLHMQQRLPAARRAHHVIGLWCALQFLIHSTFVLVVINQTQL